MSGQQQQEQQQSRGSEGGRSHSNKQHTISYETALNELCEMFPDIDKEVVILILKDNRGHMEHTIDQLLIIRGEAPINPPPPSEQQPAPQSPQQQQPQSQQLSTAGAPQPQGAPISQTVEQQIASDEALAREIQRSFAINDLMAMEALREQGIDLTPHGQRRVAARDSPAPQDARGPVVPAYGYGGEDEEFISMKEIKEKLDKLGGAAKLKLKEVWAKLKPKQSPAQQQQQQSGSSDKPKKTTPTPVDEEKRSLINGPPEPDSDEEEVAFDSSLARRLKPVSISGGEKDAGGAGSILEFEQAPLTALNSSTQPSAVPPSSQQRSSSSSVATMKQVGHKDLIQLDDLGMFGVANSSSSSSSSSSANPPTAAGAASVFPAASFGVMGTSGAVAAMSSSSSSSSAPKSARAYSESKKDKQL